MLQDMFASDAERGETSLAAESLLLRLHMVTRKNVYLAKYWF